MVDDDAIIPLAYSKQDGKFVPIVGQEFEGEEAKPTDLIRIGNDWMPIALNFGSIDPHFYYVESNEDETWIIGWRLDYTETKPTIRLKIIKDDRLPDVSKSYTFSSPDMAVYKDTETTAYAHPWSCKTTISAQTYSNDYTEHPELDETISFNINICSYYDFWKYYHGWWRRKYAFYDKYWEIDYTINASVSYHYLETHCIKDWGIRLTLSIDGRRYSEDAKLVRGSECTEHPGYATYSGNTAIVNVEFQKRYYTYTYDPTYVSPLHISATVDAFIECIGYGVTSGSPAYQGADLRINVSMYCRKVNSDTGEIEDSRDQYITFTPSKDECLEYYAFEGDPLPGYAFAPLNLNPSYVDDSVTSTIYRTIRPDLS